MITQLTINGFKAVFSSKLKLGDFTLLIGRNGAGKSTAVEALQFLRDATFRGLAAATGPYANFEELVNRRAEDLYLDLRFGRSRKAVPVHYELGVERAVGLSEGAPRPIVAYETCTIGQTRAAQRIIRSRKGKRGPAFRWIGVRGAKPLVVRSGDELGLGYAGSVRASGAQDLRDYLSRAVFLRLSPTALAFPSRVVRGDWRPMLADDGHDLPLLLERMSASALKRVAERVRKIFQDVRGLHVVKNGEERYLAVQEHMRSRGGNRTYDIPSWMLSEGMRRVVALCALMEVEPRPSLLAIEEVENGLDPWTLERVLEALRDASGEIQVLLTTHSPFLLDHVELSDVVHVRRRRGDTTYEPIADLEDVIRYRGVLAPGAMFLSNVFGDRSPPTSQDAEE
jgi:predicted ATPase